MKPPVFKYVRADSLDAVLTALGEYGEDAKILAGGQSLVPMLNFRIAEPAVLVDINPVKELDYVQSENGFLRIGARTRQRVLEKIPDVREKCPLLSEATRWIGHVQIRNRGTVGGSLVHADPTAELALIATLLDAELTIQGSGKTRTAKVEDFFEGFMTAQIAEDEVLTEVRFPISPPNSGCGFRELCIRHGDFAVVAAAAQVTLDERGRCAEARVAVAGAGPTALRIRGTEEVLRGGDGSPDNLEDAASKVPGEVAPIPDQKGSEAYRREMAKVFVRRTLDDAWAMARERS
jgi:CO/xanthine dehydrogenase FAD-binding subunit